MSRHIWILPHVALPICRGLMVILIWHLQRLLGPPLVGSILGALGRQDAIMVILPLVAI